MQRVIGGEIADCALCGSSRREPLFTAGDPVSGIAGVNFAVVQCMDCGLRYVNPRPTASEMNAFYPPSYYIGAPLRKQTVGDRFWKRLSRRVKRVILEEYYDYPTKCRSWFWRTCRKSLLFPEWLLRVVRGRDLLPYIGEGKLLDVGCGPGVNLRSFLEQGWDVAGVEMSLSAVAQARELVGDCVHLGTLEAVPFQDESFDVILFNHSLEHMFNPVETLVGAGRLLKPKGRLVITVPNAAGLEAKLFRKHWIGWDLPRHLYHFDRDTLLRLVQKAGFTAVQIRTGKGSAFFMASLNRYVTGRTKLTLAVAKVIERFLIRPLTLIAGHLGYGTEITVYAAKALLQPTSYAQSASAAASEGPYG